MRRCESVCALTCVCVCVGLCQGSRADSGCGGAVPSGEGGQALRPSAQDEAGSGWRGGWHCAEAGTLGARVLGAAPQPGPGGGGGSRGWGGRGTLAGVPPKLRVSLGAPRGGLEGRKELGARTRTDGNQRSWRPRIPGSGHLLGLGQGSPGRRPVCLVPAAGLSASGNFSLGAPSQVSPPLHSALPGAGQSP